MLDFLWRLHGSVSIESEESNDEILGRIELWADSERKFIRRNDDGYSSFEASGFFSFSDSFSAMAIYDAGHFWIEEQQRNRVLRYDLSSWRAFIFCLMVSAPFFGLGSLALAQGDFRGLNGIVLAFFLFGMLYGLNVALASNRVPAAIRRSIAGV